MKRVLLLLAFLNVLTVFSQQYEIKLSGKAMKNKDSCKETYIDFYVYLENGDEIYMGRTDTPENKYESYLFEPKIVYDKVSHIRIKATRIIKNSWGNCKKESGESDINQIIYGDCGVYIWEQYTKEDAGILFSKFFYGDLTVNYKPIVNLKRSGETNIGYDKEFNISVLSGSDVYASRIYNWQYSIGTSNVWKNMPSWTNGKKSFNITPKDFLEGTFLPKDVINKEISFRINTCDNNDTDAISYTIRKSAPSITNNVVYQSTCYENSDAYVRVFFERQIGPGESISYVLYDTDKGAFTDNGKTYYVPTVNKNNITAFKTSGGKYYLDIVGIPPSKNYKFEIIGYNRYGNSNSEEFKPEDGNVTNSGYEGAVLYTGDGTYNINIVIPETPAVEFTASKIQDITCNGAANGKIRLSAKGGLTGSYQYKMYGAGGRLVKDWTNFSSGANHTIAIAKEDTYKIFVRDSNGCNALQRGNEGNITTDVDSQEIPITEPLPLTASIVYNGETKEPTAHGFTDGVVSIKASGGNHNNIGYTYTWYKDGSIINNPVTSSSTSGKDDTFTYTERLLDIGAGRYKAVITDAKGCTTSVDYSLGQPAPLKVVISVAAPISCNSANIETGSLKTADGKLKATASGGVGKYIFTWKKKENGTWKTVYTSPKLEKESIYPVGTYDGIGAGEYAVNIKDENGIIIGEYKDNALERPTNIEHELQEPDPIIISISLEDVYCNGGNNAWIEAGITGGTLKDGDTYRYEWSNGETTNRIENLYAGTYTLYVYDSNDCYTTREVVIDEPDKPLMVEVFAYKQPKATGLTDGYIQYKITGGTPKPNKTYNYQWTDSAGNNLNTQVTDSLASDGYFIKLNNIGKGTYSLTVTDANYSKTTSNVACKASTVFEMDEPDPLELTIEETRVISCNALNEYGNSYSDGALTAHAKGGVWLQSEINDGLRYYYTWKKKNANGTWRVLTSQTDSIAVNLDAGEYAVNIKDANGVVLGNYGSDNELEEAIDTLYTLEEPPLLEISTTQQNVYCYAGSDAWAEVSITGGTAPYDIEWSNGDTTARATELSAKTYEVHVTDDRGCEAIAQVTITEPEAPVSISYPQYNRPTSIDANDAWIEAVVTGGTSFDDDTYTYFWEDEEGTLLNAQTSPEMVDGSYVIRLKNIPAGTYYLTVQDKNYGIATTKLGCTHANSEFVIDEPIEAVIEIETPISCNTANEYQDPFSDGALIAHITGGVPFESGLPYIYHWRKQNEAGQWEDLTDQLDSIALNLNDGNYALNVEDSKGTVMGRYSSDNLTKAIDSTFYFKEPDLLEVSFTTTEVNCDAGNDGSATVHITGGAPPYTIKWSNGQTTQEIKKLIGGNYFVFVTDSRGCEVSGNVEVAQPGGIRFDVVVQKDPTCFEGNDGAIRMNITGGIPPYEYQWNTGGSTNSISNLSKGKYTLRVIDSQDCIAYKEIVLEDPEPVYIDLGKDRTLCDDQEFSLDIAIDDAGAGYYWESDNGFTSADPQVTLSEAGIYTAIITTALGCVGQDQIEVKASSAVIDADFLITSQAFVGQEVVLVNVSSPLGEGTEWHVPDGVTVVSESNEAIILKFKETGSYEVRLRTLEGDCYQDYTKQIVVEEPTELYDIGEAEQPFLKKFLVYPNPNDGNFTVKVELSETADVALRLISLLTADVSDTRNMINSNSYSEPYSMALASGTYILLLETPKGNEVRRVIIK
ncbi:T9SS type A sorting domain-containing protein [Galbibacter sp. PAP.153]|uniref:T9SS type A sorting domain-containing protein n=1 Tax=Galbibacter sp. PAP.153 TaxID=3104623 RepID=UPI003009DD49